MKLLLQRRVGPGAFEAPCDSFLTYRLVKLILMVHCWKWRMIERVRQMSLWSRSCLEASRKGYIENVHQPIVSFHDSFRCVDGHLPHNAYAPSGSLPVLALYTRATMARSLHCSKYWQSRRRELDIAFKSISFIYSIFSERSVERVCHLQMLDE